MNVALPSPVLALLCLLQAGAQVSMQLDLDTEKVTAQGVWHVTAIASNCSIFLKMKDGMKSPMAIISFMPEGGLAMKLVWPLGQESSDCATSPNWSPLGSLGAQEKRDLHVMETDYSHYTILHEAQHSEAEPSTALQLLTREQDLSPQLLQKFTELIPTMGLTEDTLAILPKSGGWPEGTGWQ
ncbi:LCN15 protein, partial [Picathartes gymnocephalus]|nr:LCN15 protein [Picathartes gymnocephalus]